MLSPISSDIRQIRSTKVMTTITDDLTKDDIISLFKDGINIARFDGSTGKDCFQHIELKLQDLRAYINDYNKESNSVSHFATALDLKGSFYETGIIQPAKDQAQFTSQVLENGQNVSLTNAISLKDKSDTDWIYVNCNDLMSLESCQIIFINEEIKLIVESVEGRCCEPKAINCRVLVGGLLSWGRRMEVNIPGLKVSLSPPEDLQSAVEFCKRNEIDILIASINDRQVFGIIKDLINFDGNPSTLKLIAKIETEEAFRNVDNFIEKVDGLMVLRDRLCRNISPEQVVTLQKKIIAKCLKGGILSVVAGNLFESMKNEDDDGTRAEIADVVSFVLDGADCVMLKNSTRKRFGVLHNTIMEAEAMINYRHKFLDILDRVSETPQFFTLNDVSNVIASAACTTAMVNESNAIIVVTGSEHIVLQLSMFRPKCPIIAVTRSPHVARLCCLYRGVNPILFDSE